MICLKYDENPGLLNAKECSGRLSESRRYDWRKDMTNVSDKGGRGAGLEDVGKNLTNRLHTISHLVNVNYLVTNLTNRHHAIC